MREYDGVDYRYKSGDQQSNEAMKFLSGLLGFPPDTNVLEYDLNLYAGGIGVDDRLAFSCAMSEKQIESAAENLHLIAPMEAMSDPGWGEDFAWLINDEGEGFSVVDLSIRFINKNRKPFQKTCSGNCRILFGRESNVNTWTAVWISEGIFNYLSFDQG